MLTSSTSLVPVLYGDDVPTTFQETRTSRLSLDALVAKLRKAIEAANLWVLHEIDPQMLLSRGGFSIRPARQLLFFHPRYVARLLEVNPPALMGAPLKFVLAELPDLSVSLWAQVERAWAGTA